jgi:hypothetical protein
VLAGKAVRSATGGFPSPPGKESAPQRHKDHEEASQMQSVAGDFRPNLCDLGVFVVRFAEFRPEWTGATWPPMLTLTGCKARKSVHPIALCYAIMDQQLSF